jgi:hypothetical protein
MTAGLLLALALSGSAWGQETGSASAPAGSTETVSSPAAAVETSSAAVFSPVAAPEKPAVPKSRVIVHKEAVDWEPVSVRLRPAAGGRNSFEAGLRKAGGSYRGRPSAAKVAARLHSAGDDRWLVVCVYPVSLRSERMHMEARFFIQEGYLEEVKVAAVRIAGGRWSPDDEKEDSFSLKAKGMDFNEQMPASAEITLAVIDPRLGPHTLNAGSARHASFGGEDLGFVNFSWSVTGVSGEKAGGK